MIGKDNIMEPPNTYQTTVGAYLGISGLKEAVRIIN